MEPFSKDDRRFPGDESVELPSTKHQQAVGSLYAQIYSQLQGAKHGRFSVFMAPFVVWPFENRDRPQMRPDIALCDKSKLEDWGCNGAPELAALVLSPRSHRVDRLANRELYCEAGVRELWIVDPEYRFVEVFLHDTGAYRLAGAYQPGDTAYLQVVEGCAIDIGELFPKE